VIERLDAVLRQLLITRVAGITVEEQVRFEPPDDAWRTYVSTLAVAGKPANALNVYLVDVRENRVLRDNEPYETIQNGVAFTEQAPARIDCHYLISAWSPANPGPAVEPTLDEHALIYRVSSALFLNAPLNPSRVYTPGAPALATIPQVIRNADLPTQILPAEGFTKLPEFWGGMGAKSRWKPAVYLVVTLPVVHDVAQAGTLVTTRIIQYGQMNGAPSGLWIQIGGTVRDNAGEPVTRAWVQLETPAGGSLQTTTTNDLGRFNFDGLGFAQYRLRTRAAGLGEKVRDIDVPAATGEYDLRFP
jgi:hypothetical protein